MQTDEAETKLCFAFRDMDSFVFHENFINGIIDIWEEYVRIDHNNENNEDGENSMNKTEFLETLSAQLSGQMQEGRAAAHIRYYRDYIEQQVRSGHNEDEVLSQLGDPRLIAKTLIDTDPDAGQEIYEGRSPFYEGQGNGETNRGDSGYDRTDRRVKQRSYRLDLTTWYGKAIVLIIAAAVIIGLLALIGAMMPLIIVVCLVLALISWIRRR